MDFSVCFKELSIYIYGGLINEKPDTDNKLMQFFSETYSEAYFELKMKN